MRKLDYDVFDMPECPEDAVCAAVDADGRAFWYRTEPCVNQPGLGWFTPDDFPGIAIIEQIPGEFDATDWTNSKILRKDYKKMNEMPELQSNMIINVAGTWYLVTAPFTKALSATGYRLLIGIDTVHLDPV